ncbi:hypothetical protein FBGL_03805 [Flavobacterium glycines]|uniref:Uncharacterized protein n=1 Tax=Flavobacterium glycines TaxID=551990 RepID=A0A1B9DTJ4_9FLAO|nr:hypothetical protein FBGL_03805 [Flavobacterium glycines]
MKRMLNKYIFFLACSFVSVETVAQFGGTDPDCPTCVPPPVGLPIDRWLIGLFVAALFFGFCKIYSLIIKKKRSV